MRVPIAEARARFADLLRAAERGDEVILTRHGKDVAVLLPMAELTAIRADVAAALAESDERIPWEGQ